MRETFTVVSFAAVPVPEIGHFANKLLESGFCWKENGGAWEARFAKQIPYEASIESLQDEVRSIMGAYYTEPDTKESPADAI